MPKNLKVFTVYDSKAECYLQPFCAVSRGAAIRMFTDSANNEQHQFSKYPADFTLFELGDYDECTAKYTLLPTPVSLGLAIEFKNAV